MTKSELIELIASRANITKKNAEDVFELVFNSFIEGMKRGDRIEIRGFGSWYMKDYKSYKGRNPKTGESLTVLGKKLPFFKVGKELKLGLLKKSTPLKDTK